VKGFTTQHQETSVEPESGMKYLGVASCRGGLNLEEACSGGDEGISNWVVTAVENQPVFAHEIQEGPLQCPSAPTHGLLLCGMA